MRSLMYWWILSHPTVYAASNCSLLVSCSQDCLNWSILPPADGALMMRAGLLRGRFSGDPSFVYEHTVSHRTGEGEGAHEETTTVEMKEEDRVAAVVATIEEEVGIVPQGAVMKTPTGVVKSNKAFEGVACFVCALVCASGATPTTPLSI